MIGTGTSTTAALRPAPVSISLAAAMWKSRSSVRQNESGEQESHKNETERAVAHGPAKRSTILTGLEVGSGGRLDLGDRVCDRLLELVGSAAHLDDLALSSSHSVYAEGARREQRREQREDATGWRRPTWPRASVVSTACGDAYPHGIRGGGRCRDARRGRKRCRWGLQGGAAGRLGGTQRTSRSRDTEKTGQ
jgi:hypothetical protein